MTKPKIYLLIILLVAVIFVSGWSQQSKVAPSATIAEVVRIGPETADTVYQATLPSGSNSVTVADRNGQKASFDLKDPRMVQFVSTWSETRGTLMTIGNALYAVAENREDKKFLALDIEKDKLTEVEQGSDGSAIIRENGNVVNTITEKDVNTNDRAAMVALLLGLKGQKASIVTLQESPSTDVSGLSGAVVKKFPGLNGGLTGFQIVKGPDSASATKKKSVVVCTRRPALTKNQKTLTTVLSGSGGLTNCGMWCTFSCGMRFPAAEKCMTCSGGIIFGTCK